tara:strand:- start:1782 stop:1949 length:168 start_codon:yes stop_codon:yes gene_type:complete
MYNDEETEPNELEIRQKIMMKRFFKNMENGQNNCSKDITKKNEINIKNKIIGIYE